jgi:hypothetical protein
MYIPVTICLFILLAPDPSARYPKLIKTDKVTRLLVPRSGTRLQLASNDIIDIPADCFIHPQTGRVLPIMGNVAYDPDSSKMVFTVDSATGKYINLLYWDYALNMCI